MSELTVVFDTFNYDEATGMSRIEGWGIDPDSKSPLTITSKYPILFDRYFREDVIGDMDLTIRQPYGFSVQFPGDYRKVRPSLTFSAAGKVEHYPYPKIVFGPRLHKLKKLRDLIKKHALGIAEAPILSEPEDPLTPWFENEEEKFFHRGVVPEGKVAVLVRVTPQMPVLEDLRDQNAKIILIGDESVPYDYPVYAGEYTQAIARAVSETDADYFTIVDGDDRVSPHFTDEILHAAPFDLMYADSDCILDGKRYDVSFKPDFDEVLLRQTNYVLRPLVFKKELFEKIGPWREGLKDYDLLLKLSREAQTIKHVPLILYHWNKKNKSYGEIRDELHLGKELLNDFYGPGSVNFSDTDFLYENALPEDFPPVAIILGVPLGFGDKTCVDTIEDLTASIDYPDYHIYAVNVEPFDAKNTTFLESSADSLIGIYNDCAGEVCEPYLLFISPGFKSVEMGFLKEMMGLLALSGVGIVGPKIYNEYFKIESAGLSVEDEKRIERGHMRYIKDGKYRIPKKVLAVSLDCLLISRKLFEKLGGFDGALLSYEADIDLSLRAQAMGYDTVLAANTPVRFNESLGRDGQALDGLIKKHGEIKDTTLNLHDRRDSKTREYDL